MLVARRFFGVTTLVVMLALVTVVAASASVVKTMDSTLTGNLGVFDLHAEVSLSGGV
ncbi:MAG: hypothetical protein HYX78_10215, partial [Armatimonadetes bacterium]|nr:hypothetical protein [Armatimonadota bacterium]